jgi:hypothetical protein
VPSKPIMALAEPPRTDERHRWCEWVARRGIDPAWIRELARAGGSETWYVVERPVPATEWLRSFDTISGAPFGRAGPGLPGCPTGPRSTPGEARSQWASTASPQDASGASALTARPGVVAGRGIPPTSIDC